MKDCLFCNVTFEPKKPKQKFCSAKCRTYFSRQQVKLGKADLFEVRINPEKLEQIKSDQELAGGAQAVVDFLVNSYVGLQPLREPVPYGVELCHVNLNDPKEGSGAFYLKYGCSTYKELEELKKK